MRPIQDNDVFHALAHPARRSILLALRDGERTASDLAEPFHTTFAAISQHLRVLQEAELVSVRREGRQRLYRLDPRPLQEVVGWVDAFAAFFERRLDALGEYLDRKHGKSEPARASVTARRRRAPGR
ncbi:MAG TPA: metalloregulator ArsR/SmtB family transcription factor [Polyangia bacterium]|nr:metalloregulator ArsR/SmtB family transcription factor [Polyangia bacterium]